MKLMLALLSLFVFNINSQASETLVAIVPTKTARCDLKDFTLVNVIYNIKKIETDNELKITFNTSIGSCRNQKIDTLKFEGKQHLSMFREGMTLPWSYLPSVEYEQITNDILKISINVNKSSVFNRKNVRNFQMAFHPGDFENSSSVINKIFQEYFGNDYIVNKNFSTVDYLSNLNFLWNLSLTLDKNGVVKVLKLNNIKL